MAIKHLGASTPALIHEEGFEFPLSHMREMWLQIWAPIQIPLRGQVSLHTLKCLLHFFFKSVLQTSSLEACFPANFKLTSTEPLAPKMHWHRCQCRLHEPLGMIPT